MKKLVSSTLILLGVVGGLFIYSSGETAAPIGSLVGNASVVDNKPTVAPTPTIPFSKTLPNDYHIFQTFNNCGPAALSMALSYYGISVSQEELGQDLRPNQHPKGIQDDKSVTLDELGKKGETYGFIPYHRPNGSIEIINQFISNDIPVVARTWLKSNDDIGHYRVVKGYDEATQQLVQDDSLQGKNISYSYQDFLKLWEAFNYEYLVLVPRDKETVVRAILKENADQLKSWKRAAEISLATFTQDPHNTYAGFNLSVAYANSNQPKKAIEAFEHVQDKLSRRMLWYQIEPIQAYLLAGNYQKVHELSAAILASENKAYAELYLLKAEAYRLENKNDHAKNAFNQALTYNQNLLTYQSLLSNASVHALQEL